MRFKVLLKAEVIRRWELNSFKALGQINQQIKLRCVSIRMNMVDHNMKKGFLNLTHVIILKFNRLLLECVVSSKADFNERLSRAFVTYFPPAKNLLSIFFFTKVPFIMSWPIC